MARLDEVNLPKLTIYKTMSNNEREKTRTNNGEAGIRSMKTKNETSMNNKERGKEELNQPKLTISKTETNNESRKYKSEEANKKSKGTNIETPDIHGENVKETMPTL